MSDKIYELAKKLKALADRGEGGERINAEEMLKRLMEEHGITLEDIEETKRDKVWFKVRGEQDKLFGQVCAHVYGDVNFYTSPQRRGQTGVTLSPSEALTVHAMFEWYWKLYKEELAVFHTAFVMKHRIYKNAPPIDLDDVSREERERRERARTMAEGMQDKSFVKRIKN